MPVRKAFSANQTLKPGADRSLDFALTTLHLHIYSYSNIRSSNSLVAITPAYFRRTLLYAFQPVQFFLYGVQPSVHVVVRFISRRLLYVPCRPDLQILLPTIMTEPEELDEDLFADL